MDFETVSGVMVVRDVAMLCRRAFADMPRSPPG